MSMEIRIRVGGWLLSGALLWATFASCASQTASCVADAECPAGYHCQASTRVCHRQCQGPSDCASGLVCSARGLCTTAPTTCQPFSQKKCDSGDLYWFDSCGVMGVVAERCGGKGCASGACKGVALRSCGDGSCDEASGEDCQNCPNDCGCSSPAICKGGLCVAPECGNGVCDVARAEDCGSCRQDCPCAAGESCRLGVCQRAAAPCGDGNCDATQGENCSSCPKDCPCAAGESCISNACQSTAHPCGDGICDATQGETCASCPKDCACKVGLACREGVCRSTGSPCGDGRCDAAQGEDCSTCPKDCACLSGRVCSKGSCQTSCIQGTMADFTSTTQKPVSFHALPLVKGKVYHKLTVTFDVFITDLHGFCKRPDNGKTQGVLLYLMEIRVGKNFCGGGRLFSIELQDRANNGQKEGFVWIRGKYTSRFGSPCSSYKDYWIVPVTPKYKRHLLGPHKKYPVKIVYDIRANSFEFHIGSSQKGAPDYHAYSPYKGTAIPDPSVPKDIFQLKDPRYPIHLQLGFPRFLSCTTSDNCCVHPPIGWKYTNVKYEICE